MTEAEYRALVELLRNTQSAPRVRELIQPLIAHIANTNAERLRLREALHLIRERTFADNPGSLGELHSLAVTALNAPEGEDIGK